MNRRGSTVLDQRLEVIPSGQHSRAAALRGINFSTNTGVNFEPRRFASLNPISARSRNR
jgi:hypothetical protein